MGWASCQLGYSTINGSCLAPGGRDDWGTFFRFYRRNATITFSRSDFEILDVDDMSDPQLQNITPAALFTALDAILYRPERADETLKIYDIRSAEYILTQTIGVKLWSSLQNNTAGLKIGRNWLRNLVTLPVYVFQPTYIELAPNLLPLPTDNGTEPQPNLPAENYVVGSYCTENKRSIPGRGTVYAYTAVAGLLLALVIIAKTRALRWNDMTTSDFAVLDYHVLTKVVDGKGDEVSLREELGIAGRDYGTSALLDRIPDLRVGLR
ncbi:hypothetical protein SLS60_004670 [Paraconiothyrium brasiliense]|uniref:Uncharacterized protein n=1 Tax=Paraconiothyrium brasiliense TaxID=300254 RepID=A0ABR3RMI5_9PLEO